MEIDKDKSDETKSKVPRTVRRENVDFSAWKFLVVDDSAFMRSLTQGMLSQAKAGQILQASNGGEAIEVLNKTSDIDCILSDWNMDPIGGLKLLQMIRAGEVENAPRGACFILLTGHTEASVGFTAIALDANAQISKPAPYEKLIEAIDAAMRKTWEIRPSNYYEAILVEEAGI